MKGNWLEVNNRKHSARDATSKPESLIEKNITDVDREKCMRNIYTLNITMLIKNRNESLIVIYMYKHVTLYAYTTEWNLFYKILGTLWRSRI
jgi:hypothetical protein